VRKSETLVNPKHVRYIADAGFDEEEATELLIEYNGAADEVLNFLLDKYADMYADMPNSDDSD